MMTEERPLRRPRAAARKRMRGLEAQAAPRTLEEEIVEIKHRLQLPETRPRPTDVPNPTVAMVIDRPAEEATFRLPKAMHETTFALIEEIRVYLEQDDLRPSI